jgi:hypothetical protein
MKKLLWLYCIAISSSAFTQNVGINNTNPQYPLSFNSNTGDKISFWSDGTTTHYGIGIQSGLMQLYAKNANDCIAFGYGSSSSFMELIRINGLASLTVNRFPIGGGITAIFQGSTHNSFFNFGSLENIYIRAGKDNGRVILNDIPGGRVGVGTDSPAEMLDVSGNVRAQRYKYATPKTSYYSISPTAFSPMDGTFSITRLHEYGVFLNAVSGIKLVAPVNLPHNARITRFTAFFYDNSTSHNMTVWLNMKDHANGRILLADLTSSGNAGIMSGNMAMNHFVDNQTYSYFIECFVIGGWPGNTDLQLSKITIEYTMDEPM